MEARERFKVEQYGGDCCDFEQSSVVADAFELLDPNDYPEDQRKTVEEFNRRAETGNRRYRMAMYRAEMFEKGFNAGMYICTFDRDENMTGFVFTDETRRMLGYDGLEDLPNEFDSWVKTLLPEQREAMVPIFWNTVKNHRQLPDISHAEYPMVRKDGKIIWVTGAGRFIRREDGSLEIYMGCYRDVTAEHEKDDYLHIIKGIGKVFNFSLYIDMATQGYQIVSTNEYVERVRKDPNAFQFLRDNVDSSVHPDYRAELKAWLQPDVISALLEKKDTVSKDFFSSEADMWFRAIFMIGDRDGNGIPSHIIYGCQDITYEKTHEIRQRKQLEKTVESERAQVEEIAALNDQLQENQTRLEEVSAQQEAQLEEITALNTRLESNQTALEEARRKAEEEQEKVSEAYGMIEGLSQDYHTIWVVDKETSRMHLVRSTGVSTIQNAVQMGKDLPEFDRGFDRYINTYVEPEDRERMHREIAFAEILRQLDENPGKLYAVNYLRRDDSGHVGYHQIAFANADTKDGKKRFVYGFRDVDKLIKEEQAQREELRRLNADLSAQVAVIGGLSNAYFVCYSANLDTGKFTEVRQLAVIHDMLKDCRTIEEAFARFLSAGVAPEDLPRMTEFTDISTLPERLKDTDAISLEYRGRIHSEWNRAGWIAAKRDADGRVYGVLYVVQEITGIVLQRKRQEDELKRTRDLAQAANAAKTSFLFNMSHDIRTPMNAIIGYANLMKRNPENSGKWPDYLDKILQSSDFLLGLINNVLEMARIESGKTVLDENVYAVDDFIDQVYSVFADEMGKKDLKFTKSVDVRHPYIYCDNIKLREILLNILSNAQKYTLPGGSVAFSVRELPSDREGWICLETTVADTGIGMSEEYLPHIFEEFSREKNSSGNRIQGTGLGMPIVKKLVDLMGGTIRVKSKAGEGSTFIVTIPHRIAENPGKTEKEADIGNSDFAGKRILLAEDNDLNAEIATEILSEYAFQVERAEDGVVCVDMLSRAKAGYYDLILMDIQMPNLDGYSAARTIRNMNDIEKAEIPIIAMTANAFDEDKRNALEAGMDGHVAKPIEIPVLMKTLAEVFKDRSSVKHLLVSPKPETSAATRS